MKDIRIVVGMIAIIIATLLITAVCISWEDAPISSKILGAVFYTTAVFGIWYTIDSAVRESNK